MRGRNCQSRPARFAAFAKEFGAAIAILAVMISGTSVQAQDDDRVLAIGGSVTEIIYALGQQDRLVARDTTSSFPPEAEALPDVGYMRALSPEGVLSVNPDLVIAEAGSGPPETIEVLEEAAINFVMVPDGYDRASIGEKIRAVAAALGVDAAGEDLAAEVDADLAEAEAAAATGGTPPRVLFILSMQGGRILASGTDTGAAGIIALAGGENAVTEFDGYKPLTDEAVTALAPDVILMMDRQGDHSAADAELFSHPALSTTPAAQTGSVVRMDGLLMLGFGPRTPEAVRALSAAFDEARG
ncbi:hemin ABC transporter substrate-binding protein [Rhodophyticola sp. CCM32]|nr:hemin ABC transporter substrate-binding protein [Rhodophyticola sp. CCM32]